MTTNVVLPPRGMVPNAVAAHALLDDSPRRPAMVGVAVGLVFFVGFLGWAGFATGDHTLELSVGGVVAASAPFRVTPAAVAAAVESPAAPSCVARSVSA